MGFDTHMIAGGRACSTSTQPIHPTTTSETSPHYAEALPQRGDSCPPRHQPRRRPAPVLAGREVRDLARLRRRLPELAIGQSGAGKSTYIGRRVFLAAGSGRQVIAFDGKGDRQFVQGVTDAYLAANPDATIHVFPDQPLDGWRGDRPPR